jgi:hypothetical protein
MAAPADGAKDPTFLAAAREALLPKDAFGRAVLALVALRTPIVWLTSWLLRGEPIAVTAMYRPGGDVQYYELVSGMSRGNIGETNLFESAGQGLHSFPFGSIWLHSLFFAAFGAWGILLADTLVTILGFVSLVLLARACRLGSRAATAFGAFVCGYLYFVFTPLTNRFGWMPDLFWGDRFPRPFLTEIFAALSYAVLIRLWLGRRPGEGPAGGEAPGGAAPGGADAGQAFGAPFWAFAGIVFSLLLQSDIYTAFFVGLGYAVIVGERLLRRPEARLATLRGTFVFVLVLAATAWPLAVQQLSTPKWLLVRWGVYPISRLTALSWARFTPVSGPILVALAAALAVAVGRKRAGVDTRVVAFWGLIVALATVAFTLFFVIVGKGLYPYHSADRLRRVAMFAVAMIALVMGRALWPGSSTPWRRRLDAVVAGALLIGLTGGIVARAIETSRRDDHVRTWYKLGPGVKYRAAFTELARELDRPEYRDAVVLGTLDQQVHVHWQAFKGGRSFVPDSWISVGPNEEMERRFVLFSRLIGASAEQFLQMAQAPGHCGLVFDAMYSANSAYTIAPHSDYTEAQLRRIKARDIFTSFTFEIPISEFSRMRRVYEGPDHRDAMPRLDLIVLNNDAEVGALAPPEPEYGLVFHNAIFRLYARKGRAAPP